MFFFKATTTMTTYSLQLKQISLGSIGNSLTTFSAVDRGADLCHHRAHPATGTHRRRRHQVRRSRDL